MIDGAGHWVQQERPDEVNAALMEFLKMLDDASVEPASAQIFARSARIDRGIGRGLRDEALVGLVGYCAWIFY